MDLADFIRDMQSAASSEEPVAQQPLSPVRLSQAALQQARAIQATTRQTVHVGNAYWRKRPARRRAAPIDQSSDYDAYEYPPDAQQDTQQERNEKADANWRRTLPRRQSQRLATAQRHDAR